MSEEQINAQILFKAIAGLLQQEDQNINAGRMMSAPAMTYKGKVFAFYYDGEMIFRLGRNYDFDAAQITTYHVLAPFQNKAPMHDWFHVPFSDHEQWEILARHALEMLRQKLD